MANEVELINGVTKREFIGQFVYYFPTAVIKVTVANQAYEILQINDFADPITAKFSDVAETFGQTEVVGYIDELAKRGFFFDSEANIFIAETEEDKKFAPGGGQVKTSFESTLTTEIKSQTLLLKKILHTLQSIEE